MNNKGKRTNKYLLLVLIMIAVFILPSCRTRITNNSEVSNVQYDEDGFLSETYEMRREELGLSTAERPILPDFGSAEDSNDDFSEGESIDYNPDDYQEDFTEPQTNTNTNTNTGTNRTRTYSPSRSRYTPSRRSSSDDDDSIIVLLDLNNGVKGTDGVLGSIAVEEGGTYKDLPTESPKLKHPKGYKFIGWYTKAEGGEQVTAETKVTETENHTLFAHWEGPKKEEKEPEEVTVTIKYNIEGQADKTETVKKGASYRFPDPGDSKEGSTFGGWKVGGKIYQAGQEIQVTSNIAISAQWENTTKYKVIFTDGQGNTLSEQDIEEGKGATAPENPTRAGYDFDGWDKDFNKITDEITITAKWNKKKTEEYWQEVFADVSTKNVDCYVEGADDTAWIQDCKARIVKNNPKVVLCFTDNIDDNEYANTLKDKFSNNPAIYLISSESMDNEKIMLAYQIRIINLIHEEDLLDAQKAANELRVNVSYKKY